MTDIYIRIHEGESFEGQLTLKDQGDGTYRLNHPNADPNRIFYKENEDLIDLASNALMHLNVQKR